MNFLVLYYRSKSCFVFLYTMSNNCFPLSKRNVDHSPQYVPTPAGGYNFTCQHGPNECAGNEMLACARQYIGQHETYVKFTLCVMSTEDPPKAFDTVSARYFGLQIFYSLTTENFMFQYQYNNVYITSFNPNISFIRFLPYMYINFVQTQFQ